MKWFWKLTTVLFALSLSAQTPVAIPDTLDLPTALSYALENNFAIRQAQQRIKEQDGLIVEVRSLALPNVSVSRRSIPVVGYVLLCAPRIISSKR